MTQEPEPKETINVCACSFRRYEASEPEKGILIHHGRAVIDTQGQLVPTVWSYTSLEHHGCFNF